MRVQKFFKPGKINIIQNGCTKKISLNGNHLRAEKERNIRQNQLCQIQNNYYNRRN